MVSGAGMNPEIVGLKTVVRVHLPPASMVPTQLSVTLYWLANSPPIAMFEIERGKSLCW